MKTFFIFLIALSAPIALASTQMQDERLHPEVQNGTTAPALQSNNIGSELSSLPASVTRYMATRQGKEETVKDTYEPYGSSLCALPGFKCIRIPSHSTWFSLWPNEHQRELVMRLNRTNVALKYRHWLVVPKQLSHTDYMRLSPLPEHITPPKHKLLVVDLRIFAFGAYDSDGNLVYWGPATGGQKWCSDTHENCKTVTGHFKIFRIQGENCQSSKYPIDTNGGAPMPYCMHYYRGFAIHGSTLSGFNNRSRGCIRVFYSDAKWLNHDFVRMGTRVIVRQ